MIARDIAYAMLPLLKRCNTGKCLKNTDIAGKLLVLNVISLHGYDVLNDKSKIKKTIEEHANSGFDFLSDKIKDESTFLEDIDYLEFIRDYQKNP